jgi:hypothetical protein
MANGITVKQYKNLSVDEKKMIISLILQSFCNNFTGRLSVKQLDSFLIRVSMEIDYENCIFWKNKKNIVGCAIIGNKVELSTVFSDSTFYEVISLAWRLIIKPSIVLSTLKNFLSRSNQDDGNTGIGKSYLSYVCVDMSFSNQGIGGKIMAEVYQILSINKIRTLGCHMNALDLSVLKFYKKSGWLVSSLTSKRSFAIRNLTK